MARNINRYIVAGTAPALIAGFLGGCTSSSPESQESSSSTVIKASGTPPMPSPEQSSSPSSIPSVGKSCVKFSVTLVEGNPGKQIFDPSEEPTYFVTNLGPFAANPNNPNQLTENTVELKHFDHNNDQSLNFIHDYGSADIPYADGSSAQIAVQDVNQQTVRASGVVCEPTSDLEPVTTS